MAKYKASELELKDKLVYVGRTAKVVKGGRRFSFSAMVVVGDGNGHVGYGIGKAGEVVDAVRKATDAANKNIVHVNLQGNTVPHEVIGHYGSANVLIRPATGRYRSNCFGRSTCGNGIGRRTGCTYEKLGFNQPS